MLKIRGIDFVDDDNITIRFLVPGGKGKKFMDVEGEFVNDTTLQCITPEFVDYGAGVVQVRISLRNQVCGHNTPLFLFPFFLFISCVFYVSFVVLCAVAHLL